MFFKNVLGLFLLFVLSISNAFAGEGMGIKRVAILEFRGIGVSQDMLLKLSDQARLSAVDILPKDQYSVMTRENMMLILSDMGKDASCMEGSCEVEIGRNIGADFVVTGNIMEVSGEYLLTLKLHETASGELLSGEEVRKAEVLDLVEETRKMSLFLYSEGLGIKVKGAFDASKTLNLVGTGFLIASGATAGVAYSTQKQYDEAPDLATAQSIDTTNRIASTTTPIFLGLSLTSYAVAWWLERR